MVKYPVSDKQSASFVRPHIKKNYYPAKLISVKEFRDKDKNWKEGKYGRQLIFEFGVYKADQETDAPICPMQFVPNPDEPENKVDVILPNFVYHQYKDQKTGEYKTAFTPNSAITKLMKCLGWEFTTEGCDPEEFIGNWVELTVDDYEIESTGEVISTIKDVGSYKGPKVSKDIPDVEKKQNQDVRKNIKHSEVEKAEEKSDDDESPEIKAKREKISQMEQLNKDGLLTDEGLKQAKEQLEAQIEELKKEKK